MGRGSQQKNDRPAHVFLKRATREQFREQRLRQGRMPVVGPARLGKQKSTFRGSQISPRTCISRYVPVAYSVCNQSLSWSPYRLRPHRPIRGARAFSPKKATHRRASATDLGAVARARAPVLNACPAPSTRMGWPQRGLREQPRKAAADARFIVYVRLVVPSLGHRASSAAMRGWSRAWCRVL